MAGAPGAGWPFSASTSSWICGGSVTCGPDGSVWPGSGVVAAGPPTLLSSEVALGGLAEDEDLAFAVPLVVLLPPGAPLSTLSGSVGSLALMPGWYGPIDELQSL